MAKIIVIETEDADDGCTHIASVVADDGYTCICNGKSLMETLKLAASVIESHPARVVPEGK